MKFVPNQFFPASDRPEILVDWTLPRNSTIAETKAQMDRFEKTLEGDPDISHWSSYVGQSAVRFILTLDVQPPNALLRADRHRDERLRSAGKGTGQDYGAAEKGFRRH